MKHLKLYEQYDFEDLSDEELFGKEEDFYEPKVGDKILILPKLEEYIISRGWAKCMMGLIGREFYIDKISKNMIGIKKYETKEGWYFYRDCFKVIQKK